MKPNTQLREVKSGGIVEEQKFGLSQKNSGFLMRVLRDSIYSDKMLAVLREYSANAWDEHRQSGKGDLPIKVTLPTSMDRVLRIRDFGRGLSREDVLTIYTQYGESTKRGDNETAGMLGIGSKAGFAYADAFTVTSWHKGMRYEFVAALDKAGDGSMKLLHEEPCGEDEGGIEIGVSVKESDVNLFLDKARSLFKHFEPRPDINCDLPQLPEPLGRLSNGVLFKGYNNWTARMGCVPYRVDTHQLYGVPGYDAGMLRSVEGVLHFNIGELEINASREGLAYDEHTKQALVDKINDLCAEYVLKALEDLDKNATSPWDKRLRAQTLREMSLPLPEHCSEVTGAYVSLSKAFVKPQEAPRTFAMLDAGGHVVSSIAVSPNTKVYFKDDHRVMAGFALRQSDYIIRAAGTHTLDEARQEFEDICATLGMSGIPTDNLSTVDWTQPLQKGRNKNAKHRARSFRFNGRHSNAVNNLSELWESESDRETGDADVFVVIERFERVGDQNFFHDYREDKKIADAFGMTMPEVYGYKRTVKRPIEPKDCKGTEYYVWRAKFIKEVFTDNVKRLCEAWKWQNDSSFGDGYHSRYNKATDKAALKTALESFGSRHPITKYLLKARAGVKTMKAQTPFIRECIPLIHLRVVAANPTAAKSECEQARDKLTQLYPLFEVDECRVAGLWAGNKNHQRLWVDYVKLVDRAEHVNNIIKGENK